MTGLSDEDRERIREYLAKPAYQREPEDLLPTDADEAVPDGD